MDKPIKQLFHYALVGIASNSAGYLVYLLATYLGANPKITITLLYGVGATLGFWGNRKLTFAHKENLLGAGGRYVLVHCLGYLINLTILIVMVDKLGYAHQLVQAIAILVVAAFLFLAFKFFVFKHPVSNAGGTMKRCLACNARYGFSCVSCPTCGFQPVLVDGFHAYAPDFAHTGSGFKSSYFSELARLEEAYFWFRSRNQLLLWAIEMYCQDFQSILEIGCGTGYVLSGVSNKFPHSAVYGSEIFTAGLSFAATRLPSANLMQMDARNIPFQEEFDVVGAFDVLEHIEEDAQVLAEVRSALIPNGTLLLTVPQHIWLWSPIDECACHVRRYTADTLHQKLTSAGFDILRSTSFVSFLLPAMLFSRMISRKPKPDFDPTDELRLSKALNALLYRVMLVEVNLIKWGIDLPVGGSRLVVARKTD